MIDEKFRKLAETAVDRVPATKRTGVKIIGLRDRYCIPLMPLEDNANIFFTVPRAGKAHQNDQKHIPAWIGHPPGPTWLPPHLDHWR